MKVGDICKCICNFKGIQPEELTIYKDDIFQIHKVIDKHWLEGMSGGCIGRLPSSVVVNHTLPTHNWELPLFAITADLYSTEKDDLQLKRGCFVIGLNPIDDNWWHGQLGDRQGMFPLSYVWIIDKSIMQEIDYGEMECNKVGRVRRDLSAQLPEEIDLVKDATVYITHIIDKDWYRGTCNGQTGIFPSDFIEVLDDISETSIVPVWKDITNCGSETNNAKVMLKELDSSCVSDCLANAGFNFSKSLDTATSDYGSCNSDFKLSRISTQWKTLDMDDSSLFDDDYFKQNMPSIVGKNPISITQEDKMNSLVKVPFSSNNSNPPLCDQILLSEDKNGATNLHDILDNDTSVSLRVDSYIKERELFSNENSDPFNDVLGLSCGYNEDNTGISPYGRAAFSFQAQFPNELSFNKGDIIHLIKHIDSHWTVGSGGSRRGMFPTSYIDIIVDCPHNEEEIFIARHEQSHAMGTAIALYDYVVNNTEDIKMAEGDLLKIIQHIDDNWIIAENDKNGTRGYCPRNFIKIIDSSEKQATSTSDKMLHHLEENPITYCVSSEKLKYGEKRTFRPEDFDMKKKSNVEDALKKNINLMKNLSAKPTNKESLFMERELPSFTTEMKEEKSNSAVLNSFPAELVCINDSISSSVAPLNNLHKSSKQNLKNNISDNNHNDLIASCVVFPTVVDNNKSKSTEESCKKNLLPDSFTDCNMDKISETEFFEDESMKSGLLPNRPAPPPPSELEPESEFEINSYRSVANKDDTETSTPQNDVDSHHIRQEAVKEMVATEYEYIHNLKAVVQVMTVGSKRKDSALIDIKSLMGNITEVIETSETFLKLLHSQAFKDDQEMLIGQAFLDFSDKMCSVYKTYCSNYNLNSSSLISTYLEQSETEVFFKWVLDELRQHKIELLDLRSVLIKPVQRILKYPLFIDTLIRATSVYHPDYKCLQRAKEQMAFVAKEINEYTKRLDLVNKYRGGRDSVNRRIHHRMSLHSLAKGSARIKTRISATLGLINQTKDPTFDNIETKFKTLEKGAKDLVGNVEQCLKAIKARHSAELATSENLSSILLETSNCPTLEAMRNASREAMNGPVDCFEKIVQTRVWLPMKQLVSLCTGPHNLIDKRHDKLLDYDNAQFKLDKNRDPAKTRILEEESSKAKGVYEALNLQLLLELPVFIHHGLEMLTLAVKTFISCRMHLHGHLAKMYINLVQIKGLEYSAESDVMEQYKVHYLQQSANFKQLSFVPYDYFPKSPVIKQKNRKSLDVGSSSRRTSSEPLKKGELSAYPTHQLYIAIKLHTPQDPYEISLYPDDIVAVIKNKDPSGSEMRWLVDNGEIKGFVSSSCLRPLSNQVSSQSGKTLVHNSTHDNQQDRTSLESQNLPTIVDTPPRYEDIFPAADASIPNSLLKDDKKKPADLTEASYYVSPQDVCASDEYDYPINNIYEEIPLEKEKLDSCEFPIYEDIPDNACSDIPAPSDEDLQFYYALYKFEANNQNYLSLYGGQVVLLLNSSHSDWWFVQDRNGGHGYVPASYLAKYT